MIELPRALKTWSEELALFPAEIASALAPLLPRVERMIGALRASDRAGNGEPDGFDGLSRRGIYDRLLLSEWLLADEHWLEFARRAATGEHAFLQLARREPQGAPLCVALFDAGPNQLGAPRLAHLAALIVLFRRAKNGGAHFRWSVLQSEIAPYDTLTTSNIRALLTARSSREATAEQWNTARETIAAMHDFHKTSDAPDVWIVGGERLQRALRVLDAEDCAPALLQIREPLGFDDLSNLRFANEKSPQNADATSSNTNATTSNSTNQNANKNANESGANANGANLNAGSRRANVTTRHLLLSVLRRDNLMSEPGEIALELPENSVCARLLRDPFATVAAQRKSTASRLAPASNLLWASANKLMARAGDGESLIVYAVPNSPRAGVGQPRFYKPDARGRLLAAGRVRKAVVAVTQTDDKTLIVQTWGKGGDNAPRGAFELPISLPNGIDEQLFPCCMPPNLPTPTLLVQLPSHRLAKLEVKNHIGSDWKRQASHENWSTLAMQSRQDGVDFFAANLGLVRINTGERSDKKWFYTAEHKVLHKFDRVVQQFFFGWSEHPQDATYGLVAARLGDELWEIPVYNESLNLALKKSDMPFINPTWKWKLTSSTRIVGVMCLRDWKSPALIEICNEREVVLRGVDWTQSLFVASAPILHASASPFAPDIAICTTSGEVAVWSLQHNAWTLRLAPDDAN